MRAHTGATGRVPPVLHIALFKLARGAQHDLIAQQGARLRPRSVPWRPATGRGSRWPRPPGRSRPWHTEPRRHGLVEQPAVGQGVEQRVGCGHRAWRPAAASQRGLWRPSLALRAGTRFIGAVPRASRAAAGGGGITQQVHAAPRWRRGARSPDATARHTGRARRRWRCPRCCGRHQLALGIKKRGGGRRSSPAPRHVARSSVPCPAEATQKTRCHRPSPQTLRSGCTSSPASGRREQSMQRSGCVCQRGAVAALLPHQPLDHGHRCAGARASGGPG